MDNASRILSIRLEMVHCRLGKNVNGRNEYMYIGSEQICTIIPLQKVHICLTNIYNTLKRNEIESVFTTFLITVYGIYPA